MILISLVTQGNKSVTTCGNDGWNQESDTVKAGRIVVEDEVEARLSQQVTGATCIHTFGYLVMEGYGIRYEGDIPLLARGLLHKPSGLLS